MKIMDDQDNIARSFRFSKNFANTLLNSTHSFEAGNRPPNIKLKHSFPIKVAFGTAGNNAPCKPKNNRIFPHALLSDKQSVIFSCLGKGLLERLNMPHVPYDMERRLDSKTTAAKLMRIPVKRNAIAGSPIQAQWRD